MRNRKYDFRYYNSTCISFYRYLRNFLKERICEDWNDIYSELISKTKPKHRWLLDKEIGWVITDIIWLKDNTPYTKKSWIRNKLPVNRFFIDLDNKIRYFETEEEIKNWILNKKRVKKLEKILSEEFLSL